MTALAFSAGKKRHIPAFPNFMEEKTQSLLSVWKRKEERVLSALETERVSAVVLRRKGSKPSFTSFESSLAGNAELTHSLFGSSSYDMPVGQSLVYLFCS